MFKGLALFFTAVAIIVNSVVVYVAYHFITKYW